MATDSSRSASFLGPEIMALGLLWLGFTLLGALQTQARDPAPKLIPAPPLDRVPLQPDFKDDQFQGKWYVVGVAGNAFKKEEQGQFTMYTTTYELKEDHSYNVTSILLRDQNCDHWIRTFIPSSQPGQFNLGDIKRYFGVQSYIVRVADTDYNQFAIVFFRKVYKNQEYFKTTLYRRNSSASRNPWASPMIISSSRSLLINASMKSERAVPSVSLPPSPSCQPLPRALPQLPQPARTPVREPRDPSRSTAHQLLPRPPYCWSPSFPAK
uniref:Lipocalin 2 n=1 Tax=Equus caballus TaxID=9796 RepID=A0A9L0T7N3_HORSE